MAWNKEQSSKLFRVQNYVVEQSACNGLMARFKKAHGKPYNVISIHSYPEPGRRIINPMINAQNRLLRDLFGSRTEFHSWDPGKKLVFNVALDDTTLDTAYEKVMAYESATHE